MPFGAAGGSGRILLSDPLTQARPANLLGAQSTGVPSTAVGATAVPRAELPLPGLMQPRLSGELTAARSGVGAVDTAGIGPAEVSFDSAARPLTPLRPVAVDVQGGARATPLTTPERVAAPADVIAASAEGEGGAEPPVFREATRVVDGRLADGAQQSATRTVTGADIAGMTAVMQRPGTGAGAVPEPRVNANRVGTTAAAAVDAVSEGVDGDVSLDFRAESRPLMSEAATAVAGLAQQPTRQMPLTAVATGGAEFAVTAPAAEPATRPALTAPVDTGALEMMDAPAEVAELSIETAVDDPNWSEALNYRLQWLAQRGVQSARIQLNPAELGPMDVTVDVVDDVATVQFRAEHGLTREALEQASPRLRELMMQAGFDRAELDISGGDSDQRQRHAASADGRSADQQAARDWRDDDSAGSTQPGAGPAVEPAASVADGPTPGGLNLYA
ncbi:MAG: flagellar hook-length control protein FliK [Pseudomonadota bacterium]